MIPPDVLALYLKLRDGCGMVELKDWSSVTLTGKDRQSFLHSFCTNDVKRLGTCEAFFTDAKGKIVGYGLIAHFDDVTIIVGSPGQGPTLVEHLDRYIIREDVQLRDTTAERAFLLLTGTDAFSPRGAEAIVYWSPLDTLVRVLLATTAIDLPNVRETRIDLGTTLGDQTVFDMLRIEAGTPLFGVDFGPKNFPQEVGRDHVAISFAKGCYLGQETVARIDALGHVNQRIAGVRIDSDTVPAAGTALTHSGAAAGHVTSAAYSPRLNAPLALAMVRREWLAVGSRLESAVGSCEVIALPLA